jgi:ribosomal protein L37AE/L43A
MTVRDYFNLNKRVANTQKSILDCPQCGRHSMVSPEPSVYRCLSCGFSRDLTSSEQRTGLPEFLFFFLGVFIMLAVLL